MDEMWSALLLDSDQPILAEGSVCHTDGAKAYRWLSSPLNDGSLVDAAGLKLAKGEQNCITHTPAQHNVVVALSAATWAEVATACTVRRATSGQHYPEMSEDQTLSFPERTHWPSLAHSQTC